MTVQTGDMHGWNAITEIIGGIMGKAGTESITDMTDMGIGNILTGNRIIALIRKRIIIMANRTGTMTEKMPVSVIPACGWL